MHARQATKYTNPSTGMVAKITERYSKRRPLYVLEAEVLSFALMDLETAHVCAFKLIKTEHPKLFILEDSDKELTEATKDKEVNNIDIFAYVNLKFVHTEARKRPND